MGGDISLSLSLPLPLYIYMVLLANSILVGVLTPTTYDVDDDVVYDASSFHLLVYVWIKTKILLFVSD